MLYCYTDNSLDDPKPAIVIFRNGKYHYLWIDCFIWSEFTGYNDLRDIVNHRNITIYRKL